MELFCFPSSSNLLDTVSPPPPLSRSLRFLKIAHYWQAAAESDGEGGWLHEHFLQIQKPQTISPNRTLMESCYLSFLWTRWIWLSSVLKQPSAPLFREFSFNSCLVWNTILSPGSWCTTTPPSAELPLLRCNHNRAFADQPFNLVIFVEDLHVVVFQSQVGVTQPGNTEWGRRFMIVWQKYLCTLCRVTLLERLKVVWRT